MCLLQRSSRLVWVVCMVLVVGMAAMMPAWLWWTAPSLAQPQDKAGAGEKASPSSDPYSYVGAESCGGSACHGNSAPRTKLRIGQNEFYIWSQKDRHAKAYEVLTNADSKRIAHNLKIDKPEQAHRCLVCHALDVEEGRQGKNFDITEGVSCEACHGPAEQWLGPHIRKDWDAKKAASYGMFNTKDMAFRSDKCLACHLGVGQDVVDHELIGAGHPRLKFELDNYSHVMPAHWQPPKDKPARDWLGVKTWAVNQAVALRNQLHLFNANRKSKMGLFPDFIHFDCFACHHDVVDHVGTLTDEEKKLQRWRTKDYGGKPGRLVWNASSFAVLRHIVQQVSPEQGKALEQQVRTFHEIVTGKRSSEGFESTLKGLVELSDQLIVKVGQHAFTQQNTVALLRAISADARTFGNLGFQSAEQAVLALASLYDAYTEAVGALPEDKSMKQAIDALYKDVKDGRLFNPAQFESDMARVRNVVASGGGAS